MKPSEYLHDALRTEHTPDFVRLPGATHAENIKLSRLLHALLGMVTEVGEIADVLKKRIIYGKPMDEVNLVEEHGDSSWYHCVLLDAVGSGWEESWSKNIAKLKARFPDKFTAERALNRDLPAERAALEAPRVVAPPGPPGMVEALAQSMRTRESVATQDHRERPTGERFAFTPFMPCKNCDDTVCATIRQLQLQVATLEAATTLPVAAAMASRDVAIATIKQLEIDNDRLRAHEAKLQADRDSWKRRAEKHGCNVVAGDPDCG